ncbi:rab-GTPase-TBC domain-containing protein [Ditylenchus destructor]|nr:rab-GTPase-TBC domain-containing protein [Ditylenchus destructor]
MDHHSVYTALDSASDRARINSYEASVFVLSDVFAEVVNDQGASNFVNGVLSIVEKSHGVFIEWKPCDNEDEPDSTWVIEGGTPNTEQSRAQRNNSIIFSVDIKEIRSYTCNDPKEGQAWVKFICKDGISSNVLHFRGGGYQDFVYCLQRYSFLSRSAKEQNLVLLTDNRTDALEKSVGMLNLNKDIVSRFIANPYATSLTALSKVTSIMAPLLDPDTVINENQIRAMSKMDQPTDDESTKLRSHNEAGFEHIFQLDLPKRPEILSRDAPVDEAVWNRFRSKDGRISDCHSLKSLIFRGGITPSLRSTGWKYLLSYYKWENSDDQNRKMRKEKEEEYYRMKLQWMSISEDQERRFSDFRDRKALIDKDVARTDRSHPFFHRSQPANLQLLKDILMTYVMHDFDLGYVQGMSDFISPVLVVMDGNEVDTFWCFVGLMEKVHKNFEMDQVYIRKQLSNLKSLVEIVNPKMANYLESHESDHMYFCFRWILVCFKREFSFEDTMYLWEVLWTEIPCPAFLLLFCVAILDGQMNMIIENKFGLTEILKHVNNLSMKINLEKTLRTAEAIFHQLAAVQDKLPRHICEILSFSFDEDDASRISS